MALNRPIGNSIIEISFKSGIVNKDLKVFFKKNSVLIQGTCKILAGVRSWVIPITQDTTEMEDSGSDNFPQNRVLLRSELFRFNDFEKQIKTDTRSELPCWVIL